MEMQMERLTSEGHETDPYVALSFTDTANMTESFDALEPII